MSILIQLLPHDSDIIFKETNKDPERDAGLPYEADRQSELYSWIGGNLCREENLATAEYNKAAKERTHFLQQ